MFGNGRMRAMLSSAALGAAVIAGAGVANADTPPRYGGTLEVGTVYVTLSALSFDAQDWNWKHNHDTGQVYEHLFAADHLNTGRWNFDPGPMRDRQGHGFPSDRVEFVVSPRKLGDCQMPVLVDHGSLGTRAAERGSRSEQELQLLIGVPVVDDVFSGRKELR